jgi:hypothetical protein
LSAVERKDGGRPGAGESATVEHTVIVRARCSGREGSEGGGFCYFSKT